MPRSRRRPRPGAETRMRLLVLSALVGQTCANVPMMTASRHMRRARERNGGRRGGRQPGTLGTGCSSAQRARLGRALAGGEMDDGAELTRQAPCAEAARRACVTLSNVLPLHAARHQTFPSQRTTDVCRCGSGFTAHEQHSTALTVAHVRPQRSRLCALRPFGSRPPASRSLDSTASPQPAATKSVELQHTPHCSHGRTHHPRRAAARYAPSSAAPRHRADPMPQASPSRSSPPKPPLPCPTRPLSSTSALPRPPAFPSTACASSRAAMARSSPIRPGRLSRTPACARKATSPSRILVGPRVSCASQPIR